MKLLANLAALLLLPLIALVILFWLAQDWWEGRKLGSMET